MAGVELSSIDRPSTRSESDFDGYKRTLAVKLRTNGLFGRKKEVNFDDVDKACVEVLTYEVAAREHTSCSSIESQSFVDVRVPPRPSAFELCCQSLQNFWAAAMRTSRGPPRCVKTHVQSNVWKLNAAADLEEDASDVLSWRRRLFYLKQTETSLAVLYTSEKDNGSLHLGCVLWDETRGLLVALEVLPMIELLPMDEETAEKVITNLQEYDIAFGSKRDPHYYRRVFPKNLYPFAFSWVNEFGTPQRLVLATAKSAVREDWLLALEQLLPDLSRTYVEVNGVTPATPT